MARLDIRIPDRFIFSTLMQVRISDINYGHHLANDKVLSYLHEARLLFLQSMGYEESNIEGASLIQADTAVVYKSEAFYGNLIRIDISVGEFSRAGFEIYYLLYNETLGKTCAMAKTGMVFFDYNTRKVLSVPDIFRQKCLHAPSL